MTSDHINIEQPQGTGEGLSRRGFLRISGAALAGALVFGAKVSTSSAASTSPKVAVKDSFAYRGRKVQLVEMAGQDMLHIDGVPLDHHLFSKTDRGYTSHLLPFDSYKNVRDLAKKLIDGDGLLFFLN